MVEAASPWVLSLMGAGALASLTLAGASLLWGSELATDGLTRLAMATAGVAAFSSSALCTYKKATGPRQDRNIEELRRPRRALRGSVAPRQRLLVTCGLPSRARGLCAQPCAAEWENEV